MTIETPRPSPPVPLPRLYAVVDASLCGERALDVVDLGKTLVEAGVRLLQLRAKSATGAEALDWCDRLVRASRRHGASFIVNDRVDWCLMSGATGVHVGQEDVPVAACRRLLGASAIIGFSTHSRAQIDAALDLPISYLAVGPVFETATKATGYEAVGVELVAYAAARASIPVVAIGGITLERARHVIDSGASAVVVISDLLTGGDPARRAEQFLDVVGEGPGEQGPR